MKRTLSLLLAVLLILLCGCAETPAPTDASQNTAASVSSDPQPTQTDPEPTQTDPEPTQTDPIPTDPEPTDPEILYYNPLTGESMESPMTDRPFAIMLNNSTGAMPQHGIGDADIVYEILIEGETRCMGVFTNIDDTVTFGAIRSARKYFVSLAQSYDAVYVHAGDSVEAKEYMNAINWDHIDGVSGPNAESYYYRNQDRINDGYRYEHTLFIKPASIRAYCQKMGCTFTRNAEISYGLQFDDNSITLGQAANKLTVWFNMSGSPSSKWHKYTTLNYNADTGLYEAYQHGADYVDGNTGEVVSFRNVMVLRSETWVQDVEGHLGMTLTGSGSGYFACNGQLVNIRWSRASDNDPFVYTLEDGSPVTFGVGSTYIAVVPTGAAVEWN